MPSVEPLSTSSTSSHARSSGGSTHGSDGASFFTRSTAVVPGRRPPGLVHGQTMSKSVWPSRFCRPAPEAVTVIARAPSALRSAAADAGGIAARSAVRDPVGAARDCSAAAGRGAATLAAA